MNSMLRLSRKCEGISAFHQHDTAWGSRIVDGSSVKLSAAAGKYPDDLCEEWASVLCEKCDDPAA